MFRSTVSYQQEFCKNPVEIVVLSQLKERPLSLGCEFSASSTTTRSDASNPPELAYYRSLKRAVALPVPTRANKIRDEDTKRAFLRYCVGDFLVERALVDDDGVLLLIAKLDEHDKEFNLMICMERSETENGNTSGFQCDLPADTKFQLTKKEGSVLTTRILHMYIRNTGTLLSWDHVKSVCSFLFDYYGSSHYEEALDVAMIAGDIALHWKLRSNEILWALPRAGFSLWALNRPLEAAQLFEELCNNYCDFIFGQSYGSF